MFLEIWLIISPILVGMFEFLKKKYIKKTKKRLLLFLSLSGNFIGVS